MNTFLSIRVCEWFCFAFCYFFYFYFNFDIVIFNGHVARVIIQFLTAPRRNLIIIAIDVAGNSTFILSLVNKVGFFIMQKLCNKHSSCFFFVEVFNRNCKNTKVQASCSNQQFWFGAINALWMSLILMV